MSDFFSTIYLNQSFECESTLISEKGKKPRFQEHNTRKRFYLFIYFNTERGQKDIILNENRLRKIQDILFLQIRNKKFTIGKHHLQDYKTSYTFSLFYFIKIKYCRNINKCSH